MASTNPLLDAAAPSPEYGPPEGGTTEPAILDPEGVSALERSGHLISILDDRVAILERHETGSQSSAREHHLAHIALDGWRHTVWHTEPQGSGQPKLIIAAKPGWGEIIESGLGKALHLALCDELPEARVVSHATHGVGKASQRIPFKELSKHGMDKIAEQGLELLSVVGNDAPLVVIGASMGTVIISDLLNLNIDKGEPVDIAGVVHYGTALVDPTRAKRDMGVSFVPALIKDIGKELFIKTPPRKILGKLVMLAASRPSLSDLPPMVRQGMDLFHGTPQAEIEKVVARYPTAVITGTKDPLAQIPMWDELGSRYPSLLLKLVEGRGHGIILNPEEAARKIAATLVEMNLY